MLDGLPLPQTPAQFLFAILLALIGNGALGAALTLALAAYRAVMERGRPQVEMHVSRTQGELNIAQAEKASAEAVKLKVDGEVSLIGVAIQMAKQSHDDAVNTKAELAAERERNRVCEEQKVELERQLRERESTKKL